MSGKSYPQLHQRIRDLIAQGSKVCDEEAGTRGAQIHQWLSESRYCLAFLDDKIPTALSDFQRVRQDCVFKLADDEEALASESAYRDDGDVLWDFRFEKLQQALGILNLASRKLEMEGHSVPGMKPSAAGLIASENPWSHKKSQPPIIPLQAGTKKSFAYDAKALKEARLAIKVKEELIAKWFGVTPRQYIRWEKGEQAGMHAENHQRYAAFVKWAQEKNTGLPPNDILM